MACSSVFFCLWQHALVHWWAGDKMPQSMGSNNQSVPNVLMGSLSGSVSGGSYQSHYLQGKSTGTEEAWAGTEELALGMGSEHQRAETRGLSTQDTAANKQRWLTQQWLACPSAHAKSAQSHRQRVESLKCF